MYFLDLERTEYSDSIHAVIGRALIVGTRFENLCKSAYRFNIFKEESIKRSVETLVAENPSEVDEKYNTFFEEFFEKFIGLCATIKSLKLPENFQQILINAKDARNDLVHKTIIGLDGCIDTNSIVASGQLIEDIENIIKVIAKGDFYISWLITAMNKEETISFMHEEQYTKDIVKWVVEL